MVFTWSVPCMKLLLPASFNHTEKTQPISAIFSPDVSFNCQHRKQDWILYFSGVILSQKEHILFPHHAY